MLFRTLQRVVLVSLLAAVLLTLVGAPLAYGAAMLTARHLPPGSPVVRALDLAEAYRQLGRAGIDCLDSPTLVYEPARQRPEQARVAEPPDQMLARRLDGHAFVIEQVALSYRSPHAVAWVRFQTPDGEERVRTLTLAARSGRIIDLRLPSGRDLRCYIETGTWRVLRSEPVTFW